MPKNTILADTDGRSYKKRRKNYYNLISVQPKEYMDSLKLGDVTGLMVKVKKIRKQILNNVEYAETNSHMLEVFREIGL